MADSTARSLAASVVGWVIVILLVWFVGGALLGAVAWLIRILLVVALIGGLIWVYFRLKAVE